MQGASYFGCTRCYRSAPRLKEAPVSLISASTFDTWDYPLAYLAPTSNAQWRTPQPTLFQLLTGFLAEKSRPSNGCAVQLKNIIKGQSPKVNG